jgi:hypothetical protein
VEDLEIEKPAYIPCYAPDEWPGRRRGDGGLSLESADAGTSALWLLCCPVVGFRYGVELIEQLPGVNAIVTFIGVVLVRSQGERL